MADFVVSCSQDGSVKLWDIANKRVVRDFTGHGKNVWGVCVSPDGELVAAGSGGWNDKEPGNIIIWRRDTGEILHTLSGHMAAVTQLRFTSNSKRLVAGSGHATQRKGELVIWDVERGQILKKIRAGETAIRGLDLSPDDRRIATCGVDGQIHLWDADSAEHLRVVGSAGRSLLLGRVF